MCDYYGVVLILELPGSSDQVQALDLGIFGIQKVIKSGMRSNPDLDPQSDDITRIINSFQRAALRSNVVAAFRQAGIYITAEGSNTEYTAVDITYARAVRGIEHQEFQFPPSMKTTFKII